MVTSRRRLELRSAVTPTKKILLAAAFVAAGYAIASQLGAPQLQIIRRPQPLADAAPASKPVAEAPISLPSRLSDAGARLVPDVQPLAASDDTRRNVEEVRNPFENLRHNELELASVVAPPLAGGAAIDAPTTTRFAPHATLRNEAPRPLISEPREQVTVKNVRQPAAIGANLGHEGALLGGASSSASTPVIQTQYSQDGAQFDETAPAAENVAGQVSSSDHYSPLPPAQITLESHSRLHIVVDGDSLAKLAERYLDDAQRASEIYELNRHVLSHPDVLPIGAELTIPSRSGSLHSSNESPQSSVPHGTAIHAASRGLVPVRPVPAGGAVMPRAHLTQPRPAAGTLRVP
jgi:nucleoid-associated protein YgaU